MTESWDSAVKWERGKGELAARGEAAAVGDRHPEVLVRIHRSVIDADFVVEVGPGGPSAFSDIADQVASLHSLPNRNGEAREVTVARADAVSVVDYDRLAVTAHGID